MATKQSKKTRTTRKGGVSPRRGAKSRREKGRIPESRQTEAEPEVIEENESRALAEQKARARESEPVEGEATIGQAEREAESGAGEGSEEEEEPEPKAGSEDWGSPPRQSPPTA